MRCFFINLDAAADRRAHLEENFRKTAPSGWTLHRIAASAPADVTHVPGRAAPGAKACFFSHRRAIEAALDQPDDMLIVEDDTLFSARGFEGLGRILAANAAWDLLMLDVAPLQPSDMIKCARSRETQEPNRFLVLDLAGIPFAGSSAYVVRNAAKSKLLALMKQPSIDLPYDVFLRELIQRGELAARFCVPFLTSLSADASRSQINASETRTMAALNALRRLLFIDRDEAASAAEIAALSERTPAAARLYGPIFSVVIAGD